MQIDQKCGYFISGVFLFDGIVQNYNYDVLYNVHELIQRCVARREKGGRELCTVLFVAC